MSRCKFCENYMDEVGRCKFCHFIFDEECERYRSDDWDILNLDEEDGWEHIQILDRLHLKGIDCYKADIWFDTNVAYLIGCFKDSKTLAKVLGLHEEVIYCQQEFGLVILNLYQEKCIRDEES